MLPSLPSLPSPAPTEDVEKGEREAVYEKGTAGDGRRQDSRSPFPIWGGTVSRKAPLHLFALTCLYVLFHLKVPTTHSETEMDRKTGRGRESRAICQNSAMMLTAYVCVDISVGRQVKMAVLKYDGRGIKEEKVIYFTLLKDKMLFVWKANVPLVKQLVDSVI